MEIKTFKDINAWKKSHELVLEVYRLTANYPSHEMFGLVSQSRRCSVSVPSNIAEGFRRRTKNDSIHFYNIAQGSLEELKYQLLLAQDLHYMTLEEYGFVMDLAEQSSKLLSGWAKAQKGFA